MARKVRKKQFKQPSTTWPDPFNDEEEEEGGESGSSSGGNAIHRSVNEQLSWRELTDEEDDGGDEGGSGGVGWPIDEERVSDLFLGEIAEDISKHHTLNQEQSIPKDSPGGGDGPGLSIERHPLISFNGVDMVIETIQSMTEDERNTYEFSNEYQHRNQARLSKRLSASAAPKLSRSR